LNLKKINKVSVIIPVHDEQDNIELLSQRLMPVIKRLHFYSFEILFVDDGSRDNTIAEIEKLIAKNLPVGYIQLSRNFGHQAALEAGFTAVDADAIITMDGDLQHPPEEIPRMIEKFEAGAEVVQMQRKNVGETFKGFLSLAYYTFFSWISDAPLVPNAADFRLVSRNVAEQIVKIPGKGKLLRAIIPALGFHQVHLEYIQDNRKFGQPSYSFFALYELALQTTFKFSRFPAHFTLIIGFVSLLAGLFEYTLLTLGLLQPNPRYSLPPHFYLLAGCVFIAAGIICWYLYFILEQVRHDPSFVVKKSVPPAGNKED
jgi:glycosyltransferase involved in cell wall biosynthesis